MLRRINIDWADLPHDLPLENPFATAERTFPGIDEIDPATFPDFLDEIGLVGMGGSGFPASAKIRACAGAHTLVVNAVECEPGIRIDQSVLLHEAPWVIAGANACAKAVGAKTILIATKGDDRRLGELRDRYPGYGIVPFPARYPAGAEKLIMEKLAGTRPPPGVRAYQLGYLVQNVVSLRAVGRALVDGIPVVERPLSLAMPSARFYKNIIAPVGLSIREVLDAYRLPYDPCIHILAAAGLMMGHEAQPEDPVEKTTTSLVVLPRDAVWRQERPCIRCGACNTACPLGLHPYSLVERSQKGKTASAAFQAQLDECFLCGVCSAVCPSDIPLVQRLVEAKKCP